MKSLIIDPVDFAKLGEESSRHRLCRRRQIHVDAMDGRPNITIGPRQRHRYSSTCIGNPYLAASRVIGAVHVETGPHLHRRFAARQRPAVLNPASASVKHVLDLDLVLAHVGQSSATVKPLFRRYLRSPILKIGERPIRNQVDGKINQAAWSSSVRRSDAANIGDPHPPARESRRVAISTSTRDCRSFQRRPSRLRPRLDVARRDSIANSCASGRNASSSISIPAREGNGERHSVTHKTASRGRRASASDHGADTGLPGARHRDGRSNVEYRAADAVVSSA